MPKTSKKHRNKAARIELEPDVAAMLERFAAMNRMDQDDINEAVNLALREYLRSLGFRDLA